MKCRLDQLLVDRGLAPSREQAQRSILAGLVYIGGRQCDKPGRAVDASAEPELRGAACPYVSRGGMKLEGALEQFDLMKLDGALALDIGASTGGFTDCLLQHGARKVWAIDVGHAQLHEKMRADPRVMAREGMNARALALGELGGEAFDIVTIDVSFISLRLILPGVAGLLARGGRVVALVKPQFEADKRAVKRGGVVRERAVHQRVLEEMTAFAGETGWGIFGLCASRLAGPAGNREVFLYLRRESEWNARAEAGSEKRAESALKVEKKDSQPPAEAGGNRKSPLKRAKGAGEWLEAGAVERSSGGASADPERERATTELQFEDVSRQEHRHDADFDVPLRGGALQIAIERVLDEIYNEQA